MTTKPSKTIYLDHAAATPLDPDVLVAMQPYLTDQFYNPSATYLVAKSVRMTIEDARRRVAEALAVRPGEVVFTAGATEANNLAVHGVMAKHPDKKVLVSAIEHASVLEAAKQYNYELIPVETGIAVGKVNIKKFKDMLDDDVVLVSIMYANNEIGSVQDLKKIGEFVRKVRAQRLARGNDTPIYLHTDAAQAPNLLPLFTKRMRVDLMSLNGSKIYGPKQSGALFVDSHVSLEPLIYGGGQEFGLRSGTENVANIVGFSRALEAAVNRRHSEQPHMSKLMVLFVKELVAQVPKATVTLPQMGLHSILHVIIPGIDNERVMMELDEAGIMCAVGSACSASSDEPSHVLKAIGLSDQEAQSSLRFSMGRSTTEADVKKTVETLAKLTS